VLTPLPQVLSIGNEPAVVRPDHQRDYMAGMVKSIMDVAPEAQGATLVVIVEAQGDWGRAALLARYIEEETRALDAERVRGGGRPFFGGIQIVHDPTKGWPGVTQTAAKKANMVEMLTKVLDPDMSGLWFHEGYTSQDGNPEKAKANQDELQKQMMHFRLNETMPSKAAPGLKEPTRFYSGKAEGKDDVLMALMMLLYEGYIYMREASMGRVAIVSAP